MIGITPSSKDNPLEDIGADAKSDITIIIANSKGWTFDSSFLPINLITKKTTQYNIKALKKTINIFNHLNIFFSYLPIFIQII